MYVVDWFTQFIHFKQVFTAGSDVETTPMKTGFTG